MREAETCRKRPRSARECARAHSFLYYLSLVILMKRFNSIKKNSEFQKVYKTGKSYANKLLVMYVKRVDDGKEPRIGISVSKKVGNSVVRHHVTRLVRESYRLNKDRVRLGLDIVVVARPAAKEADFKKIESAYLHLCGLHISPMTGPHCKYTPTCSEYAIQALKKYGAVKGMILACKRILRCNPFAEGGYDPVP